MKKKKMTGMTTDSTTIVYLPGLGDRMDGWRRLALRGWRSTTRRVELVPMRWDDRADSLADKLDRISRAIDRADARVVLVGESAGAPVALIALDQFADQIAQVITVCGMNQHARQVRPGLYAKHPAFRETMAKADKVTTTLSETMKSRIDIVYSRFDTTIDARHTLINGVWAHRTNVPGHMLAITCLITILKKRIISIAEG